MKKKNINEVDSTKPIVEKKSSAVLIASMIKVANEPEPDEETFRLLIRSSNLKVLNALKANKTLSRNQKSELGIEEDPVFLSKDFKKMPVAEAKKELLKFFKDLGDNNNCDDSIDDFLDIAPINRRTDLSLSTAESLMIIKTMIDDINSGCSCLSISSLVSWLGAKKCEVKLNAELVSNLIGISSEFIDLINAMPKIHQIDVIDLLCKKPLSITKYTEILAMCFGDENLIHTLDRQRGCRSELEADDMCGRTLMPDWTTNFIKTAKLSASDAKTFRLVMNNTDIEHISDLELPLEVIDAALEAGITYVRHCSNFEKWLENLFATRKKEKAATTKGSMPEQIAQWICEEDTNANKVCEVVELAASKKI